MGFLKFIARLWNLGMYFFRRNFHVVIVYDTITYPVMPTSYIDRLGVDEIIEWCLELVQRKTLVLDLDETLIHSHHEGVLRQNAAPDIPPDFVLKIIVDRHPVHFFVHKRPHVDVFLDIVSQWYNLVVFTASLEIYGSAISEQLDRNRGVLNQRYYRQHCSLSNGSYTKDLLAVSDDLASVFIIDNSPAAYRAFPDNAIPIQSWFYDPRDVALLDLLPFLDALRFVKDVRSVLSLNLHLHTSCISISANRN